MSQNINNKSTTPSRFSFRNTFSGISPLLLYFSGMSIIIAALSILFSLINQNYQYFLLAAGFSLSAITGILILTNKLQISQSIQIFIFTVFIEISLILSSAVFSSFSGIPYAAIAISTGFLLATLLKRSIYIDWIIIIGLFGAIGSILISVLEPFQIIKSQFVNIISLIIAAILVVILLLLLISRKLSISLRIKLIFGALILTLIPLISLSLINNQYLQTSIQNQSNQSLKVAANQTVSVIDDFFQSNISSIEEEATLSTVLDYVELEPGDRSSSKEESELMATFRSLQTKEKVYFPSYAILDINGMNIIDTDIDNIRTNERNTSYYKTAALTDSSYVSSVEFVKNSRESFINFISPIRNVNKQTISFLRVRYDAHILQSLIESNVGLVGARSYPIIIDDNGLRLADGSAPNNLYRSIVPIPTDQYKALLAQNRVPSFLSETDITLGQKDFYSAIFENKGSEFFSTSSTINNTFIEQTGIVTNLQYQPWKVIYIQEQTALQTALDSQNKLSAVISTIVAGIIGLLITIIANFFTRPIFQLTETAEKISAGDFNVRARISSNDEIGILGSTFNSMTTQIKELIDSLEQRVKDRTQELAEQNVSLQLKSRQLETVSDVAREIVSTREFETLLSTVTTLISNRFGFYHVGIFLLDEKNEYAVLRAANSEGGLRMLDRQHKLEVGQVGIVGYVTGTGEARIATDVGKDAVFFNNPDLPLTKSEMALPLKVGNKVIGALDVQSTQSNAFSHEDIDLFTTLSDQVALAISNNQLFFETSRALEESEKIHRQYLFQEWTKETIESSVNSYKFTQKGLVPFFEDTPEVKMVLETSRPVMRTHKRGVLPESGGSILAVPILLRGEPIGVIHVQDNEAQEAVWSENDISTIQAVADQVALTLENARLFEQTLRRADRERKVLEITSKIRSTNDPQQMLQIALEELSKSLGASKAQIVLNIAGKMPISSGSTEPLESSTDNSRISEE